MLKKSFSTCLQTLALMKNSTPTSKKSETVEQIAPTRKVRRVAKKKSPSVAPADKISEVSVNNSTAMADQALSASPNTPLKPTSTPKKQKGAAPKRKKTAVKKGKNTGKADSPAKRRKVQEGSLQPLGEHLVLPQNSLDVEIPVRAKKQCSKLKKSKSAKVDGEETVEVPQLQKLPSANCKGKRMENRKGKGKKRNMKNAYSNIVNSLPQEIKSKIDWSKENLDEMCCGLIPPHECKPGLVLKWIRRVSENEVSNIHNEMLNIKLKEKSLKRKLCLAFEDYEAKDSSMPSQKSETSSKFDSERYSSKNHDSSNRIVNFNATRGEINSACSKTSSNTKASPNLVRIPLALEKDRTVSTRADATDSVDFNQKEPKVVSIVPAKSIIIRFDPVPSPQDAEIEVRCRRNLNKDKRIADIEIEALDDKPVKDTKVANKSSKLPNEALYSANMFSSICEDDDKKSLNFNWGDNGEMQDLNGGPVSYLKPENDAKSINLDQSNISQMMESQDCADFYIDKPLLQASAENHKNYPIGGTSLLNQF